MPPGLTWAEWVGLAGACGFVGLAGSFVKKKTLFSLGFLAWLLVIDVASGGVVPFVTLVALLASYPAIYLVGWAASYLYDAVQ